ncbi:MAG: radical SAM protein [Chloroflexi bacterium]|nr:radical SAM protein [Chloroflexota bacterium]
MPLLVNPPSPPEFIANREGTAGFGAQSTGFAYPPHTLAVIVSACRAAGFDAHVIDAVAEKLDMAAFIDRVRAAKPDIIGLFASWQTLDADKLALRALRNAFPHAPIIALGAGVRFNADEPLIAGASHILLGDPELAFPALISGPLPQPGIVRVRDLLPEQHNHAGLIRDPAALPRPAWDAVPWRNYGFLTLFGSRGCDDRCKYCAYATVQGRAFRERPAHDVVDEMLWLARTFGPRRILVRDPVFAAGWTRAMTIARDLAAAGFSTSWECESRPEHFDRALLKQLARGGCTVIKLGLETTDPELLTQIGRIEHPDDAAHYLAYVRKVVADARRYGIRTRVYTMVGLPGQTLEHVQATARYLRDLRPDFYHPRPYVAFPRLLLGSGQTPEQIQALLPPLQAIAEERQRAAQRSLGFLGRLRYRFRRLRLIV